MDNSDTPALQMFLGDGHLVDTGALAGCQDQIVSLRRTHNVVQSLLLWKTSPVDHVEYLPNIHNKALKLRRPLRWHCGDGHSIAVTVTKLSGDGQKWVKTLRYNLFFAVDKWQKRYVIVQPFKKIRYSDSTSIVQVHWIASTGYGVHRLPRLRIPERIESPATSRLRTFTAL
jgi:hypothetical protein